MASKKKFSITTPRGSVFTEVTANGSVQARLEWNPSFARTKAENFSKAQEFVDSECLRYMNPLTPRRTGMMIKSATHRGDRGTRELHIDIWRKFRTRACI